MRFGAGNTEWKKRRVNRGGRPSREDLRKRRAQDREERRQTKILIEARVMNHLAKVFKLKRGQCPLCGAQQQASA